MTLDESIIGATESYEIFNLKRGTTSIYPVAAASVTNWITAATSGNRLTITFAADSTILAEGSYDADDDLSYTLDLQKFYVRPAGTNSTAWSQLSTLFGNNTTSVVIKNTIN